MRGEQRKIRDSDPRRNDPRPLELAGAGSHVVSRSLSPRPPLLSPHTHMPALAATLRGPSLSLARRSSSLGPAPGRHPPHQARRLSTTTARAAASSGPSSPSSSPPPKPTGMAGLLQGLFGGKVRGKRTENGEERKGDSGRGWGPKGAEGKRKTPAPLSVSRSDVSLRARRPPPTHTPSAAAPPLRARRPLRLPTSHHPHAFNLTTLTTPLSRSPPPPLASPAPPASAPPTRPRPARRSRPLRAAASGAWSSPSSASPA